MRSIDLKYNKSINWYCFCAIRDELSVLLNCTFPCDLMIEKCMTSTAAVQMRGS